MDVAPDNPRQGCASTSLRGQPREAPKRAPQPSGEPEPSEQSSRHGAT